MDCKTARLLLELARPSTADLGPADSQDLEQHLAACLHCGVLAQEERRSDHALRQAMNAVEPPAGLRDRLMGKLALQRATLRHRRVVRISSWAGAVAAVLLMSLGVWRWVVAAPRPLGPTVVWEHYVFDQHNQASVQESFQRLGHAVSAPPEWEMNYQLLIAHGLAELPGQPGRVVPQLVFQRSWQQGNTVRGVVFILDTERFDIQAFEPPSGAPVKLDLLRQDGERFAYLVLHTGENLDWLKPPDPGAT